MGFDRIRYRRELILAFIIFILDFNGGITKCAIRVYLGEGFRSLLALLNRFQSSRHIRRVLYLLIAVKFSNNTEFDVLYEFFGVILRFVLEFQTTGHVPGDFVGRWSRVLYGGERKRWIDGKVLNTSSLFSPHFFRV